MRRGGGELSKVVNLMTVDVQKVVDVVSMLNYLWSFPLQTGICLHLLWQLLGGSCGCPGGHLSTLIPRNLKKYFIKSIKQLCAIIIFKNYIRYKNFW